MIELKWYGNECLEKLLQRTEKAMRPAAEIVMSGADTDCPYDTGFLLSTRTLDIEREGDKIIGIGGYTTDYAIKVHEHPEWNFQHGKKGKWLELAAINLQNAYAEALQAGIKK